MMKKPGFSSARAKPFKLGPLTTVASVMEALSLTSPALRARVAVAPPFLSESYLPLKVAFIVNNVEGAEMSSKRLCLFE